MEVIKETLWKRCLSTPTKPPAKNSNICLSETAYQHKGTRTKCKKINQAAIIQWQRQYLMYKPHRNIASPDRSRRQATFLSRVPVHCITPFCSDALVSPPNLYPPCSWVINVSGNVSTNKEVWTTNLSSSTQRYLTYIGIIQGDTTLDWHDPRDVWPILSVFYLEVFAPSLFLFSVSFPFLWYASNNWKHNNHSFFTYHSNLSTVFLLTYTLSLQHGMK